MVGVIWFVQVVHYPLLATIGQDRASEIAQEHQRRTGWVVGAPMAIEGVTALWLLVQRPQHVNVLLPWLAAILLAVALASTLFLSVPLHEKMANSPTSDIGARLVRTNWPRTVAWTLRGVVTFVMLVQAT
jgi:formate hydrogenlyase subunit 3/multisubunit Na+/H+ antiporter MnhD subunit